MRRAILLVAVMITAVVVAASAAAYAKQDPPVQSENHSWNGYHWARTANPFTLKLGDNVSGPLWDSHLSQTSSDWNKSSVLDTQIVAGGTRPKPCKATSGRDEICSASYGNTGWLGVATIWITGGTHITQGTVKVNDFYLGEGATYRYNNEAEREHVMCQEVGHTFGLDHQDESGASLNTCMDYYHNTSATDTKSTTPNQHDYDELATIYKHLDSFTTIGANRARGASSGDHNEPGDTPSQWGTEVFRAADGEFSIYELRLPGGQKKVTHVTWTKEEAQRRAKQSAE